MSHILSVGIATLDIINSVAHYPHEDEEMRASSQRITQGGNAANTATILAQYGHQLDFCGVLSNDSNGQYIQTILAKKRINTRFSQIVENGSAPTSYITLNEKNGSRTIVHYRDLPELGYQHFKSIPVETFDWLHFEGRNVIETEKILRACRKQLVDQPVSLEIEKHRTGIECLFPLADIVIFSRDFVLKSEYKQPTDFLRAMRKITQNSILVCTWGDQGAWAVDHNGNEYHSPAFPPPDVIDTVGAGDTFNAGFINSMASGHSLQNALTHACQLAGKKVGQSGFDNLIAVEG